MKDQKATKIDSNEKDILLSGSNCETSSWSKL